MEYANYIAHCIEIARRGEYFVAPNPMVGAVLVRNSDEKILAEGWHEKFGEAHAEVNCFRNYENTEYGIQNADLSECTLFVSLEMLAGNMALVGLLVAIDLQNANLAGIDLQLGGINTDDTRLLLY